MNKEVEMADFYNQTKLKMALLVYPMPTDEQVKAFLHYTEVQYKKDGNLLPLQHHRAEYEKYSFEKLKKLTLPKMDKLMLDYATYKRQQKIKIAAARFLEEKILPELKKFTRQAATGYHGLEHTELVALRALDVALSLGYEQKSNLTAVLLAAAIHDCARTDNGYNTHHGADAAAMPEVQKFLDLPTFNLLEFQKTQIKNAAINHTTASPSDGKIYDFVQKCLCDGDRIRLSWERGHDSKHFFTSFGNELGAMNPYQVKDYLHQWDYLYKSNGIKPLCGNFEDKYYIGYTSHTGPKRALYADPSYRNGRTDNSR